MGGTSLPLRKTERITKATVLDFNKYEQKTHLILQKTPFSNLCRYIVDHQVVKTGLRFRAQSMLTIQEAAESYLLNLLGKAAKVVEHSGRKTVTARDLELVYNMDLPVDGEEDKKEKKMPHVSASTIMKLFFKKAGVEKPAVDLYGATSRVLHTYLLAVLDNCNSLVQSRRTQNIKSIVSPTVSVSDVAFALNSVDSKIFGISSASRPRRIPLGPKGALAAAKNKNRSGANEKMELEFKRAYAKQAAEDAAEGGAYMIPDVDDYDLQEGL